MKNTSKAMEIVPETTEKVNTFAMVMRNFEKAYESGNCGNELQALSMAVAYSVINTCIDPQRKTAADRETVSDNGYNPALLAVKRGIAKDLHLLDNTTTTANRATKATFTADGDSVTETADKTAETALASLISKTLTDGIDLVQEASLAIWEQAINHATAPNWLETPYTVRKLSKRVYIQSADSCAYSDVETTPIQEVYRAVREKVQDSRAIQVDPCNPYTYIEMTTDGLDTIYHRLGKYADLGGYACTTDSGRESGCPKGYGNSSKQYTADETTVEEYETMLARLELTTRQATVLEYREKGNGYQAIATNLGVSKNAIVKTVKQIQKKATDQGYRYKGHR